MPDWSRKAVRFGGAGAALLVAGSAAVHAGSFAFQTQNPALSLRLDPSNPVATVRLAQQAITLGKANQRNGVDVLASAKRSIREQPLNAPAFRLYGMVRAANADMDTLGSQMDMADRLSRRDLGAQLFLIEDSVRRNDIAGALHHYDTALRVQSSSRTLLYPVLTAAIDEPLIRQRFRRYLRERPPWMETFLRHAISTGTNPGALAALAIKAGGFPKGEEYASLDTELMVALESASQFPILLRYFRSLRDADQTLLTRLAFTQASTDRALAPVAWLPYAITGIDSVFVSAGRDLELESTIDAGFAGPVARKLAGLTPGTYRLSAAMRAEDFRPDDKLRWQISCPTAGQSREIFSRSVMFASEFTMEGSFIVPPGCPVQRIEIIATTGFGADTVNLTTASPRLNRQ